MLSVLSSRGGVDHDVVVVVDQLCARVGVWCVFVVLLWCMAV